MRQFKVHQQSHAINDFSSRCRSDLEQSSTARHIRAVTSRLLHSLEDILLRTVLFIKLLSCLRSDIVISDTLIVLLTYLLTCLSWLLANRFLGTTLRPARNATATALHAPTLRQEINMFILCVTTRTMLQSAAANRDAGTSETGGFQFHFSVYLYTAR